ncbi:MAG TPA: ATP-binding protein, partial [Candidatus Limnocylindria bacterium]|nr:ATP-binding protein [Candidatus Limnocylindria bacterium]
AHLIGKLWEQIQRMWQPPNNQVYKTVIVLWLTLSVASVCLAVLTWFDLARKLKAASEAVAIRDEADTILRMLSDAKSGQYGYTITGNPRFLEHLNRCRSDLPSHFQHLVQLGQGDPAMLGRVAELRAMTDASLEQQQRIVRTAAAEGEQAAAEIVSADEDQRITDNMRGKVSEIRASKSDLISEGGLVARSQLLRASLTSCVAGILGIGAGIFAFRLSRIMLRQGLRERELIKARLTAERSSQEKTAFLANMSHEIRTPMNAILGFGELLEGELHDPRQRRYLRCLRSSASSLLQLINDVLDMSKIEAGVTELCLEPTDPREICDLLQTIFSEPAIKKGVRLEFMIAEDLPHALLMDRTRLRQVLVNLVGNAVKFTDRGTISVLVQAGRLTNTQIKLRIEVRDTGVGIPRDKLDLIFTPFMQAGVDREKEKAGTGLGLSIVRRLTEMMGGDVTVISTPGQGSTFSLSFPNVTISTRQTASLPTGGVDEIDFNELQPATILVVDDNELNCQLVAGMFTNSHHRLHFESNGEAALTRVRELRPDLVLMDIRMPGLDGRETLTEMRKIPEFSSVPVLAVTASSLLSEEADLQSRFSGHLRKPFSKQELFKKLQQFLGPAEKAGSLAPPAPAFPDPVSSADLGELVAELRRLLACEWPSLRSSLAFDESKVFAMKLQRLSQRWPCPSLNRFAQNLAHYSDSYSVLELERHLAGFPTFVERLGKEVAV